MLDEIDRKILSVLMKDGRITWTQLASKIGLSAPSTIDRVRKLKKAGAIQSYVAIVDPRMLDLRLLAFVFVSMATTGNHRKFLDSVRSLTEVQECHVLAGESDYLLKVRCRDGEHLEELLRSGIRAIPGVSRTSASITLSTAKETTALLAD